MQHGETSGQRSRLRLTVHVLGFVACVFLGYTVFFGPPADEGPELLAPRDQQSDRRIEADLGVLMNELPGAHEERRSVVQRSAVSEQEARAVDETRDSSWSKLPRAIWRFPERAMRAPESIHANDLYRHVQLNPGDKYLDPTVRSALKNVVDSYRPKLARLQNLNAETMTMEMEMLKRAGLAKQLAAKRFPATEVDNATNATEKPSTTPGRRFVVSAEANKPGNVLSISGGQAHWASMRQMPMAAQTHAAVQIARHEFGLAILTWFESRKILPQKSADELRKRFDELQFFVLAREKNK